MSKLTSIAGMLLVLLFSFGLDRIWEFLRQENARTFNVMPKLWLSGILDLAFAGAVLALGWFVLFKSAKSLTLSLAFFFAGLLLIYSYPLWTLVPTAPLQIVFGPAFVFFLVPATSYEYHAAAFIVIIGAAGLIRSMRGTLAQATPERAASG